MKFYTDNQYTDLLETIRSGTGNNGDPKIAIIEKSRYVEKYAQDLFDETVYWKWEYETAPGVEVSDADLVDSEDFGKTVTASISVSGYEILDDIEDQSGKIAEVNGVRYDTLQEAINAVPTDNTETVVKLLKDTSEVLTISAGKNIVFDLQSYTISNNGAFPVIENYGKLKISNGTITSSANQGAINNKTGAQLIMNGGKIIATGIRQAIYNDGGTLEITGTAYLSSKATERATVQNQSKGTLIITGGTIVSENNAAVQNAGTMTIGIKDGNAYMNNPVFQGATYGINSTSNFKFYDGIVKGRTKAFYSEAKIIDKEPDYSIVSGTETIDGKTYKTAHLAIAAVIMVAETDGIEYRTLQEAINAVPNNNTESLVKLISDTSGEITIKSNQKIKLDLQNYTLENSSGSSVIVNNGTLEILNGTITSDGSSAAIDNNATGFLKVNGASIVATGTRQAIYNYGGIVEITGNAYLSSVTTGKPTSAALERATVQNLLNGTMTITGGTIVGVNQQAISNEGTLIIGIKEDGNISTTSPSIIGKTYGIKGTNTGTISFYDGIIKGITGTISGIIDDQEPNTQIISGTEVIDGKTYITNHLE